MGALEKLYADFGDRVQFLVVYIREAHPTDGWQVGANEREGVLFEQPTTLDERVDVAHAMCEQLELSIPTVIDGIDDRAGTDYNAWPDRLYLVGTDGRIAYKGRPGPFGFKPAELRTAIERELSTAAGE